jgi:Xaa-Pro aminopeptidase
MTTTARSPIGSETSERIARIESALANSDYDAIVALGYASFQYLSGYWFPYGRSFPYRPSIVIWPRRHDPVILVGRDQVKGPARDSWIKDVRAYAQLGRRPPGGVVEALAEALADLGLGNSRIGIEYSACTVAFFKELEGALPGADLADCDEFLDLFRAVKSPAEIETIQRCATAIEHGLMAAFEQATPNWTEKRLHDAICTEILSRGPSTILLVTVQSGAAASGFYPTSGNTLAGFVRTDATAILDGYFADMARMAFVGSPSEAEAATYAAQLELNRRIVDSMQPGIPASGVYQACVAGAEALGLALLDQPSIGLGHSIGLNSQDFPALKATEYTELEPGMVFAIEPDTIGPGGELVHVEEMVLVTAEGPRLMTASLDWSSMPEIR